MTQDGGPRPRAHFEDLVGADGLHERWKRPEHAINLFALDLRDPKLRTRVTEGTT